MEIVITNSKVIDFLNRNSNFSVDEILYHILPLLEFVSNSDDKISISRFEQILCEFSENQKTLQSVFKTFDEKFEIIKLFIQNKNNELINTLQSSDSSKFTQIIQNHSHMVNSQLNDKLSIIQNNVESFSMSFNNMLQNSSKKGAFSENRVEAMLSNAFPSNTIHATHNTTASGDFIIEHHVCGNILIENKEYNQNVPKTEIDKFLRDIEHQKCHGIMMSQSSGIANKSHFHIEFVHGHVAVYILQVHYEPQHLIDAVNIIQCVMPYVNKTQETKDFCISDSDLNSFYKEYINFRNVQNEVINTLYNQIKVLKTNNLSNFELFLSAKFPDLSQPKFVCPKCNKGFKSKSGLLSHEKSCIK
jgi:restriction endonuclease Mrr